MTSQENWKRRQGDSHWRHLKIFQSRIFFGLTWVCRLLQSGTLAAPAALELKLKGLSWSSCLGSQSFWSWMSSGWFGWLDTDFTPGGIIYLHRWFRKQSVLRKRCGQSLIIHAKGKIIISKNRSSQGVGYLSILLAFRILVPWLLIIPMPLALEVLITGPPGKFQGVGSF